MNFGFLTLALVLVSSTDAYRARHALKKSIKNFDLCQFCNFDIGVRFVEL